MSDLVDPAEIERIIGVRRHPVRHLGRAVSADQIVYLLHSAECLGVGRDLRRCPYSLALDRGVDPDNWSEWEDQPVALKIVQHENQDILIPESVPCGKKVGTRAWWMSPDQYDHCYCIRTTGHDGRCACEHTIGDLHD